VTRTSTVSFLILTFFIAIITSSSIVTLDLPLGRNSLSESGKTIVIGTTDSIESCLDMAQAYDLFGWNIISCLSSGLVEIQPGSIAGSENILPALAESWTVSGSGTIWDFNLRQEVVFESGVPFNASVVKYTFDRNCNLTGEGIFEQDGPQLNIGYDMIIDNVTILSEFVVRFYLKIPYAPFPQLLSIPPSYIVDPMYAPMNHLVLYSEGNPRLSHPCGLGPFLLESWSRTGGADYEIRLVSNPDYWDAASGEPKVDKIIFKFYSSATSLATAKVAEDIDIAFRSLSANQIESFMTMDSMEVFDAPSPQIQYLCFNQDIYPYNETLVRQAIGAALNRTYLCDAVFMNQNIPLLSIVPSNLEYHLSSFSIYGDSNYTFSRTALNLFGYNESNKLNLDLYYETSGHYPQSQAQALVYQMQLENSGVIDVTLNGLDWPSYRLSRDFGTMPVFIYGWYCDYPDADDYAFLPFASWLNLGYDQTYPQGGIDQYNLWIEGRSAMTDMARRAAYYELQELQSQECSVIPLWQGKQFLVANLSIIGVYLDITGLLRYWLLDTSGTTTTTTTTISTTTTTTTTSSSTTSSTTNTTGYVIPPEMITLIIALSSAAVIIIVLIVIIRSRSSS
jgi:peptide/nickel transport system substrate-binding protein